MYDVKSRVATEFIDDKEILDTIAYAKQNKSNRKLIEQKIVKGLPIEKQLYC